MSIYIEKIRFLLCLPVWAAASISPFPFYWSDRDLATNMFSMETPQKTKLDNYNMTAKDAGKKMLSYPDVAA